MNTTASRTRKGIKWSGSVYGREQIECQGAELCFTGGAKLSDDKIVKEYCGKVDWEVRVRDGATCAYCGLSGIDNFDIWVLLQVDHIVPGAGDGADNKAVACSFCNGTKYSYVPRGSTREELLSDARRYIQERRQLKRSAFDVMMAEIHGEHDRTPS